jgi:hypothetical protein
MRKNISVHKMTNWLSAKSLTVTAGTPNTVTWDFETGLYETARVLISSDSHRVFTLSMTNLVDGSYGTIVIDQTVTGDITITLPAQSKGVISGSLTLPGGVGKLNMLDFVAQGGDLFFSTPSISVATPASHNHDSSYLKLIGGTITGTLTTDMAADGLASKVTAKSGYVGNILERYSGTILRTELRSTGIQQWWLNNGTAEVGSIMYSTPAGVPGIGIFDSAGNSRSDIRLRAGGGFDFAYHASSTIPAVQMSMLVSGDLAIGSATATARLHVKSSGNTNTTSALTLQNSDSTDILKVRNDGSFISGSNFRWVAKLDGTLNKTFMYQYSTGVKTGSLYISPSSQVASDTYSPTGNNNNVWAGGGNLTTGINNTMIGSEAGDGVTSGSSNIFITTAKALNGITTGSTNIVIGSNGSGAAAASRIIQIGHVAQTSAAQPDRTAVFGTGNSATEYTRDFFFGSGYSSLYIGNGQSVSFYPTWSEGTDASSMNMVLSAAAGTGTGTPGDLFLATATKTGAGSGRQSVANRVTVKGDTGHVGIGETAPTVRLQVKSTGATSATSGLIVTTSAGVNTLQVRDDGAVFAGGKQVVVTDDARMTDKRIPVDASVSIPQINPGTMVVVSDIPQSERIKLETAANWNNDTAEYIGPPIVNTYQGQAFTGAYRYVAEHDNVWYRLLRG